MTLSVRQALRQAHAIDVAQALIEEALDTDGPHNGLVRSAQAEGLGTIPSADRRGHFCRVIGEVGEAVAAVVFADAGYTVFDQITTPGVHGVDLLMLTPDDAVLALEVKGTLRAGTIPRLTPARRRQMSREWLASPTNHAMKDWNFEPDDLFAAAVSVDLAHREMRIARSDDFKAWTPIHRLEELSAMSWRG